MAKKKMIKFEDIQEKIELANQYQKEMNKIREDNDFDKKEAFIEKCKEEVQREDVFLDALCGTIRGLCSDVYKVGEDFMFAQTLLHNNVVFDEDDLSIYRGKHMLEYEKTYQGVRFYYSEYYDYQEYKNEVCFIDWNVNMMYLLEDLQEFEDLISNKVNDLLKEVQKFAEKTKQEQEKERYEMYLKLKEEFENSEEELDER